MTSFAGDVVIVVTAGGITIAVCVVITGIVIAIAVASSSPAVTVIADGVVNADGGFIDSMFNMNRHIKL